MIFTYYNKIFLKNKGKIRIKFAFAIMLITLLAISAFSATQVTAQTKMDTVAKLSITPKTIGIGQYVLVTGWVTPQPQVTDAIYTGFVITITKPDGTTYTKTIDSDGAGTFWFIYTPDMQGDYTGKFTWAGDKDMEGCESLPAKFSVTQTEVPIYPDVPITDEAWSRPINDANRGWEVLGGAWMQTGRNERDVMGSCFNPYTKAPESAHILWKLNTGLGGMRGGEYGNMLISGAPAKVIMLGRAYYMRDGIHCVDLRTGEELWNPPVKASGSLFALPAGTPSLWTTSGAMFSQYNAFTGALMKNVTGPGADLRIARTVMDHNGIFYVSIYDVNSQFLSLTKWNSTKATYAGGWKSGIIWETKNETLNIPSQALANLLVWQEGGIIFMSPNGGQYNAAFNDTDGKLMWDIKRTDVLGFEGAGGVAQGIGFAPGSSDMKIHGYDMLTGEEVWESEPATEPWGAFCAYHAGIAYGKYYYGSYDGYVRALDVTNGKTVWKFYSGDSGYETPYGTWAFYGTPAIADGKVYMATSEHTPTNPLTRGNRLYCLNAETGEYIWSIMGCQGQTAVADGVLISSDGYSSYMYAFAKGETTTTVNAPLTYVPQGSRVLISGTVMDQSPAQPNTPAISDEDMTAWMEHLHMQQPLPDGTSTYQFYPKGTPTTFSGKGVEVKLTAIDSKGNSIDIGTATSDASGYYSISWTPPTADKYTIMANFEGTKSYYPSYAETALGVSAASTSTTPSTSASPSISQPINSISTVSAEIFYLFAGIVTVLLIVVIVMLVKKK